MEYLDKTISHSKIYNLQNTGGGSISLVFDAFNVQWSSNCTAKDYVFAGIVLTYSQVVFACNNNTWLAANHSVYVF
jgi:hypothetical protein